MTLAELPVGSRGTVRKVLGSTPVIHRLMEMGLVPGAPVRVLRVAPLGDPLELDLRGYRLALRRREAAFFEVEAGS